MGGISDKYWLIYGKNFSRNFKQGYRLYSEKGISATLNAIGGGPGGNSGLYLINRKKH